VKTKDKGKTPEHSSRKMWVFLNKEVIIWIISDFSSEAIGPRKPDGNVTIISKCWKELSI
jgi:hypothetical protein